MKDASDRRVLVTGIGAVSGLGRDVAAAWSAAADGRSCIRPCVFGADDKGPGEFTVPIAGMSQDALDHLESLSDRDFTNLESLAKFAVAASVEAVADAGLPASVAAKRTAVIFGNGAGGTETIEASYMRYFVTKTPRVHPLTIPRCMHSSTVSAVAKRFNVHGPTFSVSSACASSGHAIGLGAMMIRSGVVDAAIVGGTESKATPGLLRSWGAINALSGTGCSPFARDRDGMVIGEGSGALVLESAVCARSRDAKIYAELQGFGFTSDSHHVTQPALHGAVDCISSAISTLEDSRGVARLIVSAHGTGTLINDANEAAALELVLGDRIEYRVTATKSIHGHLIGGSTALQVVIGLHALAEGLVPAIAGVTEADPDCRIPLVLGRAEAFDATHLLANSFAFGGLNVCLLFCKFSG